MGADILEIRLLRNALAEVFQVIFIKPKDKNQTTKAREIAEKVRG